MRPSFTAKSSISGLNWPAVPGGMASRVLAVLFQLEQSQWWSAEQHERKQFVQLQGLIHHAAASVPFYQRRFEDAGIDPARFATPESWAQIPLLTRRDIQTAGESLYGVAVPKDHGRISVTMTSGSTGQPVKVLRTQLTRLFWKAFTLRDHAWHQRDYGEALAAIRYTRSDDARPPHGKVGNSWVTVHALGMSDGAG